MNFRSLIRVAGLAVCAVWIAPVQGQDAKPPAGEWELLLNCAVPGRTNQTLYSHNLILDLEAKDRRWERVWGYCLGYSGNASYGRVLESETSGETFRLKLAIRIGGDAWNPNARATYAVDMRRGSDGGYVGTYTGVYDDRPVSGVATATLKPPRPPIPADFVPVQPGERPRMLFRKRDLPELRKKFNTPLGKQFEAVSRASSDPIALGVLYQLTGHKDYAMDAIPFVRETMLKQDPGHLGLGQIWGPRMTEVSMTYDLCYDAWPEHFRKTVDGYLRWMVNRCLRFMNALGTHPNCHPCSNFSGPIRGGGALGSLAIWGEKGPEPQAPHDPGTEATAIPPLKEFEPVKGVPVYIFRQDDRPLKWQQSSPLIQRPTDWVWAGPLPFVAQGDVLAPVGGYAKARPAPGMKVEVRQATSATGTNETHTLLFHRPDETPVVEEEAAADRLTPEEKKDQTIRGYYDDGLQPVKTSLLFCYLRVPNDQVMRFNKDAGSSRVWLNGVELFGDDFIRVRDGVYPLLVQHNYRAPFEEFSAEFVPVAEEEMQSAMAERRVKYKKEVEDYQDDLMAWKESGGMDPKREYLFGLGREEMNVVYRVMMGNGGFQTEGEGYTYHSADCPLQYAVAYRKMFGRDVTPYPRVTHFPPRYVAQAIFPGDQTAIGGKPIALSINVTGAAVPIGWLCMGFPIVPEQLKPGVLWAWNRIANVNAAKIATGDGFTGSTLFGQFMASPAYTFLHYPLDLQPKHPGECFENTWAADTKGLYIFRNGWKGGEDIVLQTYLKTQINKGNSQPNAGTFNLYGLGRTWLQCIPGKRTTRWEQNVVMFPEDEERIHGGETGVRTYYRAEKDGSGAVSVNLDFLYSGGKPVMADGKPVILKDGKTQRVPLNDYNGIQFPDRVDPDGIKGMRAFGVDYSGKCGSPMLLVLVDKIVGGGQRSWLWHMADGVLKLERNAFTITQGDANLKATFVCPAEVRLEGPGSNTYTVTTKKTVDVYGYKKEQVTVQTNTVEAIVANGPDHFFTIVTLQRGVAPPVRVEGEGLAAKVTVGGQSVRFDGEKVIIGQ